MRYLIYDILYNIGLLLQIFMVLLIGYVWYFDFDIINDWLIVIPILNPGTVRARHKCHSYLLALIPLMPCPKRWAKRVRARSHIKTVKSLFSAVSHYKRHYGQPLSSNHQSCTYKYQEIINLKCNPINNINFQIT